MEPSRPIYDSIIGGAIRMARRRWYLILAVAVLAGAAGAFEAGGTSIHTAEGSVDIMFDHVAGPTTRTDADNPTIDVMSLARRADSTKDDIDLPEVTDMAVTGDQTAGSVIIVASATTEEAASSAFRSMADHTAGIALDQIGPALRSRITALEALAASSAAEVSQIDDHISEAISNGTTMAANSPLLLQRATATDNEASIQRDLMITKSRLDSLATGLATVNGPTVSVSDPSMMLPVAGLIAGALIAFGGLMVLQAIDGRIRRRIQIEWDLPDAKVLGVVTVGDPRAQLTIVGRGLDRMSTTSSISRVLLVDLAGRDRRSMADSLSAIVDVPVTTTTHDEAIQSYGEEGLAVVFVVRFGSVSQNVLLAAVADARTAGATEIGVVLVDVPTADHAWAAVSADRA